MTTKLTFTVSLSNSADLIITDTTGFYSASNITGFNTTLVADAARYSLDDGYFLNAIMFNGYNADPVLLNATEELYAVSVPNATYASNFDTMEYVLQQDGVFTVNRYFIVSQAYYDANTSLFVGDSIVYYSDGDNIYKVVDGTTTTTITREAFVLEATLLSVGLLTTVKFVSSFYLSECYFALLNKMVDDSIIPLKPCAVDPVAVATRDLLYMSLEVIKYHKKLGNTVQIQKIIQSLDACSGICKTILPSDCGCNG